MKLHIGTDKRGIVHTVLATDARTADITQLPALLHGQEREIFGDQAYWKEADRRAFAARGVGYRVNRRPSSKPLSERWRLINRARSRTRACGEHSFRVLKQLWGFTKVRYRGLTKNLARARSCLPWLISTSFVVTCFGRVRSVSCDSENRDRKPLRSPDLEKIPATPRSLSLTTITSSLNPRCILTCAELP
jgi:hypothetical protein